MTERQETIETIETLPPFACDFSFGTIFDFTPNDDLEPGEDAIGDKHPFDGVPAVYVKYHEFDENGAPVLTDDDAPHPTQGYLIGDIADFWSELTRFAIERDGMTALRSMVTSMLMFAVQNGETLEGLTQIMETTRGMPFDPNDALQDVIRRATSEED